MPALQFNKDCQLPLGQRTQTQAPLDDIATLVRPKPKRFRVALVAVRCSSSHSVTRTRR